MASRGIPRITTPPMAIPYFACRYSRLSIYFYIRTHKYVRVRAFERVNSSFYCVNVDYLL